MRSEDYPPEGRSWRSHRCPCSSYQVLRWQPSWGYQSAGSFLQRQRSKYTRTEASEQSFRRDWDQIQDNKSRLSLLSESVIWDDTVVGQEGWLILAERFIEDLQQTASRKGNRRMKPRLTLAAKAVEHHKTMQGGLLVNGQIPTKRLAK